MTFNDCQITSNTAIYGGGVHVMVSDGDLQQLPDHIERDTNSGGGVHVTGATVTFNNCQITSNTSIGK